MSYRQTGRAVTCKKMTVEDAHSLDILVMQKNKIFDKGPFMLWTASWRRGDEVTSSIAYRVIYSNDIPYSLRFQYTITDRFEEREESLDYQIRVISTPCNLGGVRWWFICPLTVEGNKCGRRCRILYLPGGAKYFGCRECYNLSYESRQKHRSGSYEGIVKPLKQMESIEAMLNKPMTSKRSNKLLGKYKRAQLKIQGYFNLTGRREAK